MSDVSKSGKERKPLRRQRSIYQVHYSLRPREDEIMPKLWPTYDTLELKAYDLQVAGHQNSLSDQKYLGLLQCSNGKLLKPLLKESQRQEVEFYTRLASTDDPALLELRRFVPRFHGVQRFTYNGHEQEYIILEDLTERMLEPCIMDIKIGRKTWDHLASPEKIEREQSKYKQCKEEFGFCIPGYQVFRLGSGKLSKYNKEHGKKMHGAMVRAAFRNFLNAVGPSRSLCRALVVRLLGALWRLQRWASGPVPLSLRASSVLLLYDAARLRRASGIECQFDRPQPIVRRKSIHSTTSPALSANFSGQLSAKGPIYRKVNSVPLSPLSAVHPSPPQPLKSPWSEALEKLNQSHSFEHNYEDKLSKIKMNYRATLDQLAGPSPSHPCSWGAVRVIDFAHAHFTEEPRVDENFKEGIDNLVEIFESLLRETEDQVF